MRKFIYRIVRFSKFTLIAITVSENFTLWVWHFQFTWHSRIPSQPNETQNLFWTEVHNTIGSLFPSLLIGSSHWKKADCSWKNIPPPSMDAFKVRRLDNAAVFRIPTAPYLSPVWASVAFCFPAVCQFAAGLPKAKRARRVIYPNWSRGYGLTQL